MLRLILDSAAEAIFAIGLDGRCTMCDKSCLDLLGFDNHFEMLGPV